MTSFTIPRLSLENLTYYLTTIAVGAAGVTITFAGEHPNRWAVLALVVAYIAISILAFLPLVNQHRPRTHALLAVQTALITGLLWIAPELNFFVIWFYMMSVYAILALPRRQAYFWIGGFTLLTLSLLIVHEGVVGGMAAALIYASGFVFFAAFAHLTYRAQQARAESERLLTELQTAHRALQTYATQVEALAVAEERNRMAREMHDTLGHRLTVAAVQLEAAERLLPKQPEQAIRMLSTAREQVRAALADLRHTVAALREPLESALPLETAVRRLVHDFRQATGLTVHLAWPEPPPRLPPAHRLTFYRAVQEGLTNIQKHAAASQVWVTLEVDPTTLILRIRDNGRGPQGDDQGGFGLRGLRERAAHLGGEVRFGSAPRGGSVLEVILPKPTLQEKGYAPD